MKKGEVGDDRWNDREIGSARNTHVDTHFNCNTFIAIKLFKCRVAAREKERARANENVRKRRKKEVRHSK